MGLEIGTVAAIAAIAGAAASVGGATYAAVQSSAASDRQAKFATQQAEVAKAAAAAEAADARRKARYLLGKEAAAAGASGVRLEGSPLLVMLDSAAESELEAQRKLYAGELQGAGYSARADEYRSAGRSAAIGYGIRAGSTLLTSGSTYYQGKQGQGRSLMSPD